MTLLIVESIPYLAFTGAALLIGFVAWDILRSRKSGSKPVVAFPGDGGLVGKPVALPKSVTAASARLEIAVMEKEKTEREDVATSSQLEKIKEDVSPDVIVTDENSEDQTEEDSAEEEAQSVHEKTEDAVFEIIVGQVSEPEQKTEETCTEPVEAEVVEEIVAVEPEIEVSVNQATDLSEKQEAVSDGVVREESGREYTCTDVVVDRDSSVRVFDTSL